MQHFQGLLFVVILIVGYALFFHHQAEPAKAKPQPVQTAAVPDTYKASLDRAQAAAKSMEAAHREADSL